MMEARDAMNHGIDVAHKLFVHQKQVSEDNQGSDVAVQPSSTHDAARNTYIHLRDSLVSTFLYLACPEAAVDRKSTWNTCTNKSHPDVWLCSDGKCVLGGVESASSENFLAPMEELCSKLVRRSYGSDVPYVLDYAAAGLRVRVWCRPSKTLTSCTLPTLSLSLSLSRERERERERAVYDLNLLFGRLELLLALVNLSRILAFTREAHAERLATRVR